MASKNEKLKIKQLLNEVKAKIQEDKVRDMPISFQNLANLLNHLDEELGTKSCDDTLIMTINYLQSKNFNDEEIVPWLHEYGGYCDCEVLANVEDAWYDELEDYI